jgi:FkbM family methyltransferase
MRGTISSYESPRVVDAGAYYGFYTVFMAKLAGPKGRVFAFEPTAGICAVLRQNVRLNNAGQAVRVYRLALSDRMGAAAMQTSQLDRWERRWMRELKRPGDGEVAMVPFDTLNNRDGIHPDIVKIDVHGAEARVLRGMREALQRDVRHLYCEVHMGLGAADAMDILACLREAGMQIWELKDFRSAEGHLVQFDESSFRKDLGKHRDRMLYAEKI